MYDDLLREYESVLNIKEASLEFGFEGLYKNGHILIERGLSNTQKYCILAEEIGHYHKTGRNIIDLREQRNRKEEKKARRWGYEKLIPLNRFVEAYKQGCQNRYETSEYLDVTERFLDESIQHYKEKYGLCKQVGIYYVFFDPLQVIEVLGKVE